MTAWLLNRSVERQFRAIRKGFYRVVTGRIVRMLLAEELQRVICGSEVLDFAQLEKGTKYEGAYSVKTPLVRWLWELVKGFNQDMKKAFLVFVTGCDRAPIGGLSKLNITIGRMCPDSDKLPTSHTCANILLIP
jgi:ubiquitin-protein ligase E3 A